MGDLAGLQCQFFFRHRQFLLGNIQAGLRVGQLLNERLPLLLVLLQLCFVVLCARLFQAFFLFGYCCS